MLGNIEQKQLFVKGFVLTVIFFENLKNLKFEFFVTVISRKVGQIVIKKLINKQTIMRMKFEFFFWIWYLMYYSFDIQKKKIIEIQRLINDFKKKKKEILR